MNRYGWSPKSGQQYYTVLGDGDVIKVPNRDKPSDKGRIVIGNCFKDIGEAHKAAERLKALFIKL